MHNWITIRIITLLEAVSEEMDLGVMVDDKFKIVIHTEMQVNTANKTLTLFIGHSLHSPKRH